MKDNQNNKAMLSCLMSFRRGARITNYEVNMVLCSVHFILMNVAILIENV